MPWALSQELEARDVRQNVGERHGVEDLRFIASLSEGVAGLKLDPRMATPALEKKLVRSERRPIRWTVKVVCWSLQGQLRTVVGDWATWPLNLLEPRSRR
jgi:hypothetical protein